MKYYIEMGDYRGNCQRIWVGPFPNKNAALTAAKSSLAKLIGQIATNPTDMVWYYVQTASLAKELGQSAGNTAPVSCEVPGNIEELDEIRRSLPDFRIERKTEGDDVRN